MRYLLASLCSSLGQFILRSPYKSHVLVRKGILQCVFLLKLIVGRYSRIIKVIGLLKFAHCSVDAFDEVVFNYFRCNMYFLLSDKKTFNIGRLLNTPFQHIYTQVQEATSSHTQKAYDRIPSH